MNDDAVRDPPVPPQPAVVRVPAKLPGKLLYVEDEEPTRNAVASSLRRRVEEVLLAENGAYALELFGDQAPDVVVTDVAMPVLSGLGLAREIRARRPETPIIITTAHSDTSYLLEAIELGVDGYVLKPVQFEALFTAIRKGFALVAAERLRAQHLREQERLVQELREALAKVKVLTGLLPICSACKKVRDDHGYWKRLDAYVCEHSDATFTHGLCPDCCERLYPGLLEEGMLKEEGK